MKVQRGDVVLVNDPFASGSGSKVRPAVVVQCDRNDSRLDNTIIIRQPRISRPFSVPVLEPNLSASMFMRWSMLTKRLLNGRLLS